jgi:hypothetical protein
MTATTICCVCAAWRKGVAPHKPHADSGQLPSSAEKMYSGFKHQTLKWYQQKQMCIPLQDASYMAVAMAGVAATKQCT